MIFFYWLLFQLFCMQAIFIYLFRSRMGKTLYNLKGQPDYISL
mgnify:CR=1 FL=1